MKSSIAEHEGSVRRFFKKRLLHEADDLVQETLLAGMQARERFRGDANFGTFLIQIARNLLHTRYRQLAREQLFVEPATDDLSATVELEQRFELLHREQLENALKTALADLDPALRDVVDMMYWERLTQEEIGRRLDLPAGTVASRLRRARTQLRAALVAMGANVGS